MRTPSGWSVAWLLVRSDLRQFFRDPVAVLLGVALPIALVFIFGFIMGAMGGGSKKGFEPVEMAVLDEDASPASAALVQALRASGTIEPVFRKEGAWTRDELRARLDGGDEPFALVIPEGFGDGADLLLLRDPGRDIEARMVQMGLVAALFEAKGPDAAWDMSRRALREAGLPDEWTGRIEGLMGPFRLGMEGLFRDAETQGVLPEGEEDPLAFMERVLPVRCEDVVPAGRDRQMGYMVSHAVSGMTAMMLMFTLVAAARTLLSERDQGTLRRLLAAPFDPRAILLAKFLFSLLLGMLLIGVLYAFAALVFHVDVLSRWDTLLVVSLATAAACTSFALCIAAWARTDKQADGVSTLLILGMSALGGAWMPSIAMPPAARTVAKFTLTHWSLSGYQATLWYGKHWTEPEVYGPVLVVLGVAAVLGLLATWLFRRRWLSG